MKTEIIHQSVLKRTIIPVFLSLFFLALYMQPCNSMPLAKKAKFTGNWTLNESKSDFGEYGRYMAANKLVIIQKGKKLSIERFSTNPSGQDYNIMENYTLDGKECVNPFFAEFNKKSTVNWSDDKQTLTFNSILEFEWEGQEMKINTIEIYSLEDDRKTLVIKNTSITDYGDMIVKFVYDLE